MSEITTSHLRDSTSNLRNRSADRISNHSLESKCQHTVLSRFSQASLANLPRKHQKSLTISTNDLGEKRNTIETPAFSQRELRDDNRKLYEMLEGIKIMPLRNARKEELLRSIRDGVSRLRDQSMLQPELQTLDQVLCKIQCKLKSPTPIPYSPTHHHQPLPIPPPPPTIIPTPTTSTLPLSLRQISPIRQLSPPKSSKVLYTNLNLQLLCDQSTSKVAYEQVSNVDNIEYCKIMHMLGEKYEITPKKAETVTPKKVFKREEEDDEMDSVKISQLNLELQMLESLLESKRRNLRESGKSIGNKTRKTLNMRENTTSHVNRLNNFKLRLAKH